MVDIGSFMGGLGCYTLTLVTEYSPLMEHDIKITYIAEASVDTLWAQHILLHS